MRRALISGNNPFLAVMLAISLLSACAEPPPAAPVIDLNKETDALLAQDYRFAELVQEVGIADAYRQVMAADAIQLPDGGLAIGGREDIYAELSQITAGQEFSLTWEPLEAMVAASGDLGFTWGIYYYEALDELGAPFIAEGKYVYLWRKNGGRWELILDITNESESLYLQPDEYVAEDPYAEDELPLSNMIQPE